MLRESLKGVAQRQTEDHCSSLPHISWPKTGVELTNTINKEKINTKRIKEVTVKQKLETGRSQKTSNSLFRDRLASVQAMGLKII